MSSAWLLPEHIADLLPAQARRVEELRRKVLDVAGRYGYELVIPPLLEHLESLLSGTGEALDLKTFKLVDQLSGRTLGVRADTTPQVARIDAHLLNRQGVARLCYCGPVLHTRPSGLLATREPLQFGAEIYGHAGLEADLEIVELAIDCLRQAGVGELTLDLGDARVVRGALAGIATDGEHMALVIRALAAKDGPALDALTHSFPSEAARPCACCCRSTAEPTCSTRRAGSCLHAAWFARRLTIWRGSPRTCHTRIPRWRWDSISPT